MFSNSPWFGDGPLTLFMSWIVTWALIFPLSGILTLSYETFILIWFCAWHLTCSSECDVHWVMPIEPWRTCAWFTSHFLVLPSVTAMRRTGQGHPTAPSEGWAKLKSRVEWSSSTHWAQRAISCSSQPPGTWTSQEKPECHPPPTPHPGQPASLEAKEKLIFHGPDSLGLPVMPT